MSFIDSTYFTGEIQIPNVTANGAAITQAITQYEKEILIQLLGYKLYSLLIADLVLGVPVTQKYLDLVNGAEFTHSFNGQDIILKWEGLKNTALQSLIAYYVFHEYVRNNIVRLYGTGMSIVSTEKGFERVSSKPKLFEVWEKMRTLYGKIPPEYKSYSNHLRIFYPVSTFNLDPSAYNFLFANKDDYPDWIFTPQWILPFGI